MILASLGKTTEESANLLGVTFATIRTHRANAMVKLKARNSVQAISIMGRSGWLDWTPINTPLGVGAHAYLGHLDDWLASSFEDDEARRRMEHAGSALLTEEIRAKRRLRQSEDRSAMRDITG